MRQGILNVRASVLASLAFVGLAASIPTQALELYNSAAGTKVCDFTTFSFDNGTGRLNVACGSATIPTQPKACLSTSGGTFTVETPTTVHAEIAVGGTRNIRFNRGSSACGGAYDVRYYIAAPGLTGWSFNGATTNGKVHFNDGDEFVDVPFSAGTTTGNFLVQLGTTSAVPIAPNTTAVSVAPQDYWIDVKTTVTNPTPSNPTPTNPIPAGCTTTATYITENIQSANQNNFFLKSDETAAFSFTMPASITDPAKVITMTTFEVAQGGGDHQIVLSKCPGDFDTTKNTCNMTTSWTGSTMKFATPNAAPLVGDCKLEGSTKYYINARFVRFSDNSPFCSQASGICRDAVSISIPQ